MGAFRSLAGEYRYHFWNPKNLVQVLAIMCIPILYAGTFLWAFWDPYGHLNRMQVAVVNMDQGATYNGQHVDVGQNLVDKLQKNNDFAWRFVNEAQAENGLRGNTYFMAIEVPKNFSTEAVHAMQDKGAPQPKLITITNDKYNYIASIIGKNASSNLVNQTAQGLTETYSQNLVDGITKLANGYQDAANGAQQVAGGASKLSSKTPILTSGANQLASGATALHSGLVKLQAGAGSALSGNQRLLQGETALQGGLQQLSSGSSQLTGGSSHVLSGLQSLQNGLSQASTGANSTSSGATALVQGLKQYAASNPLLASDPNFQKLISGAEQVAAGASQVATGNQSLASNSGQLIAGQSQVQQGLTTLSQKIGQAADGNNQLILGQKSLTAGNQQMVTALAQLTNGASSLQNGTTTLQSGVNQFSGGVRNLSNGASQLAQKLQSAANQTPHLNPGQVAETTANPVGLVHETQGHINNYGAGFTPYFLSLGLFVGALMMSIVINFRDPAVRPSSGVAWFFGKFIFLLTVGLGQALIADLILLKGLGLAVNNPGEFIGFSILTSFTFIAIVQFFVSAFGNPGRFLALILLILQLTSSSGSYPTILSPVFFQRISSYLPMDYTVSGFRYVVGGGDASIMQADVAHLLLFLAAFLVLTLLYFFLRYRSIYKGLFLGVVKRSPKEA